MIKQVSIQNFKSILDLSFPTKRVNVFIGEPNSGKSNLLEALSLFGIAEHLDLPSYIRFENIQNIFFDNDTYKSIKVQADSDSVEFSIQNKDGKVKLKNSQESFDFFINIEKGKFQWNTTYGVDFDLRGRFDKYKPYNFSPYSFGENNSDGWSSLSPPDGKNLFEVVQTNKALREIIAGIFLEKGYKLNLNASRREINFVKEQDSVLYTYPYQLLSDTLQRAIFYTAVLESNRDSVILLEEPEAKMFPFYTKYLAEKIALDEYSNQFFIATHNPYLRASILEKTPIDELSINVVFMKDYKTYVYQLPENRFSELFDYGSDVFYNLERLLPE
ncbi:AAA family ATPase [Larkinella sp. VNQ87]|uniref:AAA family ATPase n=1 Tax=Larkinella sp. VNQ87 TaxID=3400921 RepID=UPI003C0FA487